MSLTYRPMQPRDTQECAEIVAAHASLAARYGSAISDLRPAWLKLLASESFCAAVVFEESDAGGTKILGAGLSVLVSDDFMKETKSPPHFWFGPELTKRVLSGDSPVLSERQVRDANSRGGVNLLAWQAGVRPEHVGRADVWHIHMTAFLECHRGFLLRELVGQAETEAHAEGMKNAGGLLLNENGGYDSMWRDTLADLVRRPHVIGMTRDIARKQAGSWVGSLFLHHPPRFGFSRSEQRLLLCALSGATDETLSDDLGISVSAVKKTWRSIYERVSASAPELAPSNSPSTEWNSQRGKEKKHRLMTYLREHPEELRPVSRKLLQQDPAIPRIRVNGRNVL